MPHNCEMDYPRVLRSILSAGDMNQAELAKRLRVTQPTISRWMKGEQEPKGVQHQRIESEAIRLKIEGFISAQEGGPVDFDEETSPTVPLKGYVRAGAHAQYLPLNDDELDRVEAPPGYTDKTIALEIRGDSLGDHFDRWLVFFDDVRSPVTPDLLGKLCVVWVDDGRVLVKKIKKQRNGLFTLLSNYEKQDPPIEDIRIESAARIKSMMQR